jgi:hypothetical protein
MTRTHVRANTASHAVVRNTIVTAVMSVARECAAAALDMESIGLVDTAAVQSQNAIPNRSVDASIDRLVSCKAAMYENRLVGTVKKSRCADGMVRRSQSIDEVPWQYV